ncbi:hypothetical protein GURKE_00580 [Brevundimonas phage vB_BpoS-Gurke]|uniref:Uncharacterized protein n=1 Tax=Brevundimonas phage vB_BpoS-Gurke TaxID=2948599 RepID=A0A9E7N3B4_9CAUD|nr:hypothetical protein GURKE_00580 [Brevundimonas phage vB_BpoS-Gurke]
MPLGKDTRRAFNPSILSNCQGEEVQFEKWAGKNNYDLTEHPNHYLFMDGQTYAARQGWKAALLYVHDASVIDDSKSRIDALEAALRECQDKLWIARCDSRDEKFREAAERACDMAGAALRPSAADEDPFKDFESVVAQVQMSPEYRALTEIEPLLLAANKGSPEWCDDIVAKVEDLVLALSGQRVLIAQVLGLVRSRVLYLTQKHGSPIGTPYEEGVNDHGVRIVGQLDAMIAQAAAALGDSAYTYDSLVEAIPDADIRALLMKTDVGSGRSCLIDLFNRIGFNERAKGSAQAT